MYVLEYFIEILQQVRCVEFWNFIVGALLVWTCPISPCGELEREGERQYR